MGGGGWSEQYVSWCFEPSQPLRIISGLKEDFNPSLRYSAYESMNAYHNFSTTQLKIFLMGSEQADKQGQKAY